MVKIASKVSKWWPIELFQERARLEGLIILENQSYHAQAGK